MTNKAINTSNFARRKQLQPLICTGQGKNPNIHVSGTTSKNYITDNNNKHHGKGAQLKNVRLCDVSKLFFSLYQLCTLPLMFVMVIIDI